MRRCTYSMYKVERELAIAGGASPKDAHVEASKHFCRSNCFCSTDGVSAREKRWRIISAVAYILALLFALWPHIALADEIPPRPEPPPPIEGECPETIAIRVGEPLPAGLVDAEGRATCSATLMPLSVVQDFLATEVWAERLYGEWTIDQAQMTWRLDWYAVEVQRLSVPPPWHQRPVAQRWAGRGEMLLAVVLAVVALDQVQEM